MLKKSDALSIAVLTSGWFTPATLARARPRAACVPAMFSVPYPLGIPNLLANPCPHVPTSLWPLASSSAMRVSPGRRDRSFVANLYSERKMRA